MVGVFGGLVEQCDTPFAICPALGYLENPVILHEPFSSPTPI